MSYKAKIDEVLDSLDLGSAKFNLNIRKDSIRVNEQKWIFNPSAGSTVYKDIVGKVMNRTFNKDSNKYEFDRERIYRDSYRLVRDDLNHIFQQCSPAKEPRRTKLYKTFSAILKECHGKTEFVNSLFDIAEYYYTVTETESIKSQKNDVHRKNIFQLISLMEKSYGKEGKKNGHG